MATDLNQSLSNATSVLEQIHQAMVSSPLRASSVLTNAQAAYSTASTPMGQAAAQSQLTMLQRMQLAKTELEVVKAQSQLAHYRDPAGQLLARANLSAARVRDTLNTRVGTEQMNAEMAYLRTPRGQAQARDARQADRQQAVTRENLEQARQRAGMTPLERFGMDIASAGRSVMKFGSSLQMVQSTILMFAGKASPNHVATYLGSLDMVLGRLGTVFLPLLDRLSREAQKTADVLDTSAGRGAIKHAGSVFSAAPDLATGAEAASGGLLGITMMMAKLPMWLNQAWKATTGRGGLGDLETKEQEKGTFGSRGWLKWIVGEGGESPLKRSMAGLPQPQEMGAEQYRMSLFMSGLTMGRDTTEGDEFRRHMANLVGLMEKVEANTRPKESAIPAFR